MNSLAVCKYSFTRTSLSFEIVQKYSTSHLLNQQKQSKRNDVKLQCKERLEPQSAGNRVTPSSLLRIVLSTKKGNLVHLVEENSSETLIYPGLNGASIKLAMNVKAPLLPHLPSCLYSFT